MGAPGLAPAVAEELAYLRGAAVTVVPRAEGKHAHQPLLPLRTGLPDSRLLLGLPKTQIGWLIQETSFGCSWGFYQVPTPVSSLPSGFLSLASRQNIFVPSSQPGTPSTVGTGHQGDTQQPAW